jgi:hypothetical protein
VPALKGSQNAKGNRGGRGGPEKYKEEYADQAFKYCLLGADDAKLAMMFEVSEKTISTWKKKYEKFATALKDGKDRADAEVANSLYRRAVGFENNEVELKVVSMGAQMGSEVQQIPVVKYYAPDPKAAQYWLNNRRRKTRVVDNKEDEQSTWSERHEIDHTTLGKAMPAPQVYLPADMSEEEVLKDMPQSS